MPLKARNTLPRICIVGLGNPMRGDDALGPVAADYARAMLEHGSRDLDIWACAGRSASRAVCVREDPGDPARLLDILEAHNGVVFLDAADMGAEPGAVRVFATPDEWIRLELPTSVHGLGLQELIPLAERMGICPEVRLVAVQAGHWVTGSPSSPWLDRAARCAARLAVCQALALLEGTELPRFELFAHHGRTRPAA